MMLHREDRQTRVANPLDRLIVEVFVRQFADLRHGIEIDAEAVILGGNLHPTGSMIDDREIGAVIAEGELHRPATEGEAHELVTETDTEDRLLADKGANDLLGGEDRLGVAGAVTEKDTIGIHRQRRFRREGGRDDGDIAAGIDQTTEDVVLDAEVVGDDLVLELAAIDLRIAAAQLPGPFAPLVRFFAGDPGGEIETSHVRLGAHFAQQAGGIEIDRRDDAVLGTVIAQMPGQGAGVDAVNGDDAVLLEVGIETHRCPPVGIAILILLDDEAGEEEAAALDILGIDAGVADLGVGHGDHLPLVGRVGENLLIAGHGGIKDDFPAGFTRGAEGFSAKDTPVGQGQNCFHVYCSCFKYWA